MKRKLDTRNNLRVVTSNQFITLHGLEKLDLKKRKLLYIAISQCKQNDNKFYEYSMTVSEFSNLMDISSSHVYEKITEITSELLQTVLTVQTGKNKGRGYPLFQCCEYDENLIKFELNQKMTDFLLNLHGSFTQPLLHDFLRMKSPYSIAIWHLMQREMQSKKPYADKIYEFELSLEELRQITGTENKLKQIVNFKERVLDKAIYDIKENCFVNIEYTNIKTGRTVTGFHFIAKSQFYIPEENLSLHTQEMMKRIDEKRKAKNIV